MLLLLLLLALARTMEKEKQWKGQHDVSICDSNLPEDPHMGCRGIRREQLKAFSTVSLRLFSAF